MRKTLISILVALAMTIGLLPAFAGSANASGDSYYSVSCDNLKIEGAWIDGNGQYHLLANRSYNIAGTITGSDLDYVSSHVHLRGCSCSTDSEVSLLQEVDVTFSKPQNHKFYNYDIKSSALNQNIKFAKLAPGKYTLKIKAKQFPVDGSIDDSYPTTISELDFIIEEGVIINLSGFANTLNYNKPYTFPGTITSSSNIKKVTATVFYRDTNRTATYRSGFGSLSGKSVTATWNNPSGTTLNISGSPLDSNIRFAGLAKGSYYVKVTVTPYSGTAVSEIRCFIIK